MPFELENGTDYLGLETADQIWLENDAPSGGIKWPRCCCLGGLQIHFNGCGAISLANYEIEFWDSFEGSLLTTLTTNSDGNLNIIAGTYYIVGANARFAGTTRTLSAPTTINFSPATGYACFGGCVVPIQDTLQITDSVFGSWSIVHGLTNGPDGTPGWGGSPSPQPMNSGCCSAAFQTTLTAKMGASRVFNGIQGFTPYLIDNSMTVTCFPFNYTKVFATSGTCSGDAYFTWCANPVTITITE